MAGRGVGNFMVIVVVVDVEEEVVVIVEEVLESRLLLFSFFVVLCEVRLSNVVDLSRLKADRRVAAIVILGWKRMDWKEKINNNNNKMNMVMNDDF